MNVWHVYPENDTEHHDLEGYGCRCNPKAEYDPDKEIMIVIHNSFDGREAVEEANRILGND